MSFYTRWIAACTAGELIGIGVATTAGMTVDLLIGEPRSLGLRLLTLFIFAVVGIVEGLALAGFQWRVLRTRLPRLRPGAWLGATATLAVAGWIAGMTPSLFLAGAPTLESPQPEPSLPLVLLMAAGAGAGAGLCFGVAQWAVLRHHADHAARWIWIHVPAWAAAMAAIFLGASLPTSSSSAAVIAIAGISGGLLGGICLGAITGLVARRLQPVH